jgi:RNA methyltransferase, TrmH family
MNREPLEIQSRSNPRVKAVSRLQESRERREHGLFPVEGWHELRQALRYGHRPTAVYFEQSRWEPLSVLMDEEKVVCECFSLSRAAFEGLSSRENPDGIVGVFPMPEIPGLDQTVPDGRPLILMQGLEKPGNLGAIVRSAAAFGFGNLILLGGSVDPFHPHVIRNSRGHSMGMRFFRESDEGAASWLQQHGFHLIVADPDGEESLEQIHFPRTSAILLGSEHEGISNWWRNRASTRVRIPMTGKVDSLNVAVSASILLYAVFTRSHA